MMQTFRDIMEIVGFAIDGIMEIEGRWPWQQAGKLPHSTILQS
jgi:hypothetical protein